mgnify:CR=1 FL=1
MDGGPSVRACLHDREFTDYIQGWVFIEYCSVTYLLKSIE